GDRSAVQDRPETSPVLVADLANDQAIARVHRESEPPAMPAELLADQGEAHSRTRLEPRRSRRGAVPTHVEAPIGGGYGQGTEVRHLDDPPLVQVHQGH